jgi:hypothetical protein
VREDAAPHRSGGARPSDDDDRPGVKGFGGDLPAFLARPMPAPPIET